MKRLVAIVGLLGLAAPVFADEAEQPTPREEQSVVQMTDAQLDDVVAAGSKKNGGTTVIIKDSQFATNVAFVSATGGADVDVTQVAVAIGELNVWFGGTL